MTVAPQGVQNPAYRPTPPPSRPVVIAAPLVGAVMTSVSGGPWTAIHLRCPQGPPKAWPMAWF